MRSVLIGLLISALSVGSAAAQEPVGIEIVERGLYTLEVVGVQQDPSGVSHDIVRNICHISSSTSVPKKRDVHFGFRYRLTGVPEGQEVELHAITRYPSLVMPPNGPRPLTTSGYTNRLKAGVVSYHGYGFDYDWELIPGRWSLEIWQGNRKLAAQPFDVTDGPSEVRPSDSADCFELSS